MITGNRTFSNLYERLICITTPLDNTVRFDSYTGGGHHTFVGCSFGGTYGLVIDTNSDVSGLTLLSCNFEGTTNEGFYCVGGIQGLNLSGCRFEKCNAFVDVRVDPVVGKAGHGIDIHGCYFETDAASFAVQFGGQGAPVRGFNVSGNYAQDYSSGFVRLNGDGESGLVCGNRLQNVSAVVNVVRTGVLVVNNENQSGKIGAVWNPALTAAAYTTSNVTTDRSYNATATSTAELANVLGTLIADLKAIGSNEAVDAQDRLAPIRQRRWPGCRQERRGAPGRPRVTRRERKRRALERAHRSSRNSNRMPGRPHQLDVTAASRNARSLRSARADATLVWRVDGGEQIETARMQIARGIGRHVVFARAERFPAQTIARIRIG